ncbi:GTPase ObgE [bacterium (Candidatus Moisslbacteria) CG12_big_fil_rev_8_21_14_0_65_36_11]|nr:GTPase ObgE [Candidatus Kuenenbacteria bacterium]OIP76892.1 MAG: hypothetical protein AUK09_00870 [Parcubacteria group bacterium CG2_30_36_38]PIV45906.1 MAG: GTPase ObgE [bacterium (Candidatus Moisslbacteria) CG02_land_8_20_14_3_00_36_53]PIW67980.1 MAG: GTPase ObgE [bacterium (Candidatus Moisslbacteria) CG12_big_fil_rev_8_21_14_0_65_36_11]PIZ90176.1 MAG: GTPase ObgE [bacterium (Candidatus Moisslbacteria) CG_4_10_14_0_2_um_filter_36_61]PJC00614.1 MAG: GTPase ObgE [bacterium (Candidatus Moiss
MLIDNVTIKIQAGSGGRGAVAFNRNLMSLGPAGGSGGMGGSVYFEGVSDLNALHQFRHKKEIKAENGENGRPQFKDGSSGNDLILKVPIGTVITKIQTGETEEIIKTGEKILVAKGGCRGKGNFKFRSSVNTSPKEFQEGTPGENFTLRLELKLIADVGFIGLPNVGKSSLLNELTKAKSKVANYPFTTLEPNLGAYYELILADIPGLIEGASAGKGLGIKFLRHIERTKIIFHLISAESKNPAEDYKTIKHELETYSKELTKKTEYLFLSKSDTVSKEEIKKKIIALNNIHKNVLPISIHDWDSLEKVKKILNNIKSKK